MNIIQRSSVPIYQQIFTLLLQTYRSKYLLQRVSTRTIRELKNGRLKQISYKLRQRLIWFADILRSYLTETVISLSTEDMSSAMGKAEDIDEMSDIHIKYVARLQDQALLSENLKPIHKAIASLLDLGVLFSETFNRDVASKNKTAEHANPKASAKVLSKSTRRKSVILALTENELSDSDSSNARDVEDSAGPPESGATSFEEDLKAIDTEFSRLLPFITAGLRSVGRVGAEPVWEMLAERLEWERKSERT